MSAVKKWRLNCIENQKWTTTLSRHSICTRTHKQQQQQPNSSSNRVEIVCETKWRTHTRCGIVPTTAWFFSILTNYYVRRICYTNETMEAATATTAATACE